MRIDAFAAQIPYFAALDAPALERLARIIRQRTYSPGEHVLLEGGACEGLFFVIAGQVRLIKTTADGREQVLRVLGPGATFNDVAVFDGGPNSDSAVAAGPTTVGFVPKAAMVQLIESNPHVAKAALKMLSARHRTLGTVVEDLALRDVTTRVARLLLGCVGRHEHIVEHAPEACARITHREIASMVGSVREVVQRALKELERDGAVELERGRVRVRDAIRLERWAHPGG